MNAKATVRFILLEAALVLWLLAVQLNAAQLNDVRVGVYDTFTRIVFEFDGPVQFQNPALQGQGAFTVRFLNSGSLLPGQTLQAKTKGLAYLKLSPQAPDLVADVGLPFTHFKLKAFALRGPQRIVVDAYETKPPPAPITIKDVVVKESMQPAAIPSTGTAQPPTDRRTTIKAAPVDEKQAPPQPVKVKTVQSDPKPMDAPKPVKPTRTVVKSQPQKNTAVKIKKSKVKAQRSQKAKTPFLTQSVQRYLTIALIVIGCGIVILIGFILLQKRRPPKAVNRTETDDVLQSTEDVLTAIDAKIKEKLKKYD